MGTWTKKFTGTLSDELLPTEAESSDKTGPGIKTCKCIQSDLQSCQWKHMKRNQKPRMVLQTQRPSDAMMHLSPNTLTSDKCELHFKNPSCCMHQRKNPSEVLFISNFFNSLVQRSKTMWIFKWRKSFSKSTSTIWDKDQVTWICPESGILKALHNHDHCDLGDSNFTNCYGLRK